MRLFFYFCFVARSFSFWTISRSSFCNFAVLMAAAINAPPVALVIIDVVCKSGLCSMHMPIVASNAATPVAPHIHVKYSMVFAISE